MTGTYTPALLSDVDRLRMRQRHVDTERGNCEWCGRSWPCDTVKLLDDFDRTRIAFRRLADPMRSPYRQKPT
jgi:hypothetical protein